MNKPKKLQVLCEFCMKTCPAEIIHNFDSGYDCETCGPSNECEVTVQCAECGKELYRLEDELNI